MAAATAAGNFLPARSKETLCECLFCCDIDIRTICAYNGVNMQFETPYTAPTLTVDAVIFQLSPEGLKVLLVRRSQEPFKDRWAVPGGYNAAGYTTMEALRAVVKRKAGVDIDKSLGYIEQLYTFDTIARDPRGHAVSVTYMGCGRDIEFADGSEHTELVSIDDLPPLAYDHKEIITYARARLAAKLGYTNAVHALLSPKFTLTQLQSAYEAVFGRTFDKRNFRKKFLSLGLIHETNETWRDGAHRPAKLYEFNSTQLETLSRSFD